MRAALLGAVLLATATLLAAPSLAEELQRDEASGLEYLEIATDGAAASEALPVVIAMHGLGDHPESFRLILDDLPAKARVVFPRAPMPYNADGFSWFEFHSEDDEEGAKQLGEGITTSAERVAELIDALARRYGGPARAVVCGFSQGGILSFELAAAHPEKVAAAIAVSGYLPPSLWPAERPRTRPLPKVLALHGEADHLISLESARWSVEALRSNGYETNLRSWPGVGHALSPEMRAALTEAVVHEVEALWLTMKVADSGKPSSSEPASPSSPPAAPDSAPSAAPGSAPSASAPPAAPSARRSVPSDSPSPGNPAVPAPSPASPPASEAAPASPPSR